MMCTNHSSFVRLRGVLLQVGLKILILENMLHLAFLKVLNCSSRLGDFPSIVVLTSSPVENVVGSFISIQIPSNSARL